VFVLYDSTFEGLLSACAFCFRKRLQPMAILSEFDDIPLMPYEFVPCEVNIRRLFSRYLTQVIGSEAEMVLDCAFRAFLSEQPDIAIHIYQYLHQSLETRRNPSGRLYDPSVAAVMAAVKRVGSQAHAYLGLLRFRSISPELFVADFEPDCHVLPLILPHFCDRLPDQNFVIRDLRRHLAVLHMSDGTTSLHVLADDVADLSDSQLTQTSLADAVSEDHFAPLWRRYLHHLSIPERCNPELQRANMPKKYWRYLVEAINEG
jgi:probable DNA metabolism protein